MQQGEFENDYEEEGPWENPPQDPWDSSSDEEVELSLPGETIPPDVAELSRNLIPYSGPKPGNLLANVWICTKCREICKGSKNYIADLQTYNCPNCDTMNPSANIWTLTRCTLNGISLDFSRVFNQRRTPNCVLYSFMSLCDLVRRVRGAKRAADEATKFDLFGVHRNYEKIAKCRLGEMSKVVYDLAAALGPRRHPSIEIMMVVAIQYGVPYCVDTKEHFKRSLELENKADIGIRDPPSLKVANWFRVPGDNVDLILRLIGHGIPLLAVIPTGKLFNYLHNGQIYYAPEPEGCVTHAVVLHGSAVAMPDGKLSGLANPSVSTPCEVFFRCRNCHGKDAHPDYQSGKAKTGADFNIWARHIIGDVYGLRVADSDE